MFSLSVIIPNYNNVEFISQCLDSIINQSLMPNEIVVVDDCSTDNSGEVLKRYEQSYDFIRVIYLEKNQGVQNARNTGLNCAKSEYVTFIDGDDFYYNKDKLKNEMELISKYRKQNIDILAYSAVVYTDINGLKQYTNLHKIKKYMAGKAIYWLTARYLNTPMRDYCIKKDILIDVGGYDFDIDLYEDLDLLLKALNKVRAYCTFETGTAYRNTNGGLSKKSWDEHKRAIDKALSNSYNRLKYWEKIFVRILNIKLRAKNKIKKIFTKVSK